MASLMISEMLFDVDFVSFSSAFFSSSLMRSEMTFCICSALSLFFLDDFGSLIKRFLVYDIVSSCVMCRDIIAPRLGLICQCVLVASDSRREVQSSIAPHCSMEMIIEIAPAKIAAMKEISISRFLT